MEKSGGCRGGEGQSADGQALAGKRTHGAWVDGDANWAARRGYFEHVTTERDVYDEEGDVHAANGCLILLGTLADPRVK